MDIAREAVRCHKPGGGDISVPISMFQDFRDAVTGGKEWELPEAAREAEKEFLSRKKRECPSHGRIDFRITGTAGETENRDTPPQAPGDPEQSRKETHRRGRRGNRKRRQETLPDSTQAEVREHLHRSKSQEKPGEAVIGASAQNERLRRPRRRRRGNKPGRNTASDS